MKLPESSARRLLLQRLAVVGASAAAGSALADGPGSLQTARPAGLGDRVVWPRVRLLDGASLAPEHWQSRAAVVVFFATYCPYCKRHNQHVSRLLAHSAGLPLRVLGVAHDRQVDTVRQYLKQAGHGFDVTLDEQVMHAALSLRRSIPLTCVVDRQGLLREVIPGEMTEDDVLGLAKWARA